MRDWDEFDPDDVDPDAPVEYCPTCGWCSDPAWSLISASGDDEGTPCPTCGWPYGSLRRAKVLDFAAEAAKRRARRATVVTDNEEDEPCQ